MHQSTWRHLEVQDNLQCQSGAQTKMSSCIPDELQDMFQSWRTPRLFDALVELSLYGAVSTLERFDELRFIFDMMFNGNRGECLPHPAVLTAFAKFLSP